MSFWKDVAGVVGEAAPVIGGILAGPAGAAGGRLIASALGVTDDPDKVLAALQADPAALAKVRQLEIEHKTRLQELAVAAEQNRLAADTARLAEINATIRAEASSIDPWVRRWRPFFGYVMATAFGIQMLAVSGLILIEPQFASEVIAALAGLSMLWSVGLAVVGVNIAKRSQDKQIAKGMPATTIMDVVGGLVRKGKDK